MCDRQTNNIDQCEILQEGKRRREMCVLSVIIPVFNGEKYLEAAVASVLSQPTGNYEILIVNDGSTDATSEIIEKLAKEHATVRSYHQDNAGVSSARNVGLLNAKGMYVFFLDADDLMAPNLLTESLMQQLSDQQADVFMFSSIQANVKRTRFRYDFRLRNGAFPGKHIFPASGTFASSIYSMKLLREHEICFDDGVGINEDQVFKMKALYMASVILTHEKTSYIYCYTPTSVTHTKYPKIDLIIAWKKAYAYFDSKLEGEEKKRVLSYIQVKVQSRMLLYAQDYALNVHSEKQLEQELSNIGALSILQVIDASQVMPYQTQALHLFQTDRKAFIKAAKKENLKLICGRLLLKIPFVRAVRDHKRYPLKSYE